MHDWFEEWILNQPLWFSGQKPKYYSFFQNLHDKYGEPLRWILEHGRLILFLIPHIGHQALCRLAIFLDQQSRNSDRWAPRDSRADYLALLISRYLWKTGFSGETPEETGFLSLIFRHSVQYQEFHQNFLVSWALIRDHPHPVCQKFGKVHYPLMVSKLLESGDGEPTELQGSTQRSLAKREQILGRWHPQIP